MSHVSHANTVTDTQNITIYQDCNFTVGVVLKASTVSNGALPCICQLPCNLAKIARQNQDFYKGLFDNRNTGTSQLS